MTEIASSEAEVKVTSVVEAVVAATLIGLGVIVKAALSSEAISEAAVVSLRLLDFKQLVEETEAGGTLDLGGLGGGIFCRGCCGGCCCSWLALVNVGEQVEDVTTDDSHWASEVSPVRLLLSRERKMLYS